MAHQSQRGDQNTAPFSLSFMDSSYAGYGGCNSFGGIYAQGTDMMFAASPIATEMGCPGTYEKEIFALFSEPIKQIWRTDGMLELSNTKSQLLLKRDDALCSQCSAEFKPYPDVSLNNSKWLVRTINGMGTIDAAQSDFNRAHLVFSDTRIRFEMSCNTIGGVFRQANKRLETDNLVSTAQSCGTQLDAEEKQVYSILTQSPWIAFGHNNEMVMGNSNGVIALQRIDVRYLK